MPAPGRSSLCPIVEAWNRECDSVIILRVFPPLHRENGCVFATGRQWRIALEAKQHIFIVGAIRGGRPHMLWLSDRQQTEEWERKYTRDSVKR